MKEPALGLVPDLTGTKPLVEIVGVSRALEICATARKVHAQEALALGLVQKTAPAEELSDAVSSVTEELLSSDAEAVRATKRLLQDAASRTLGEQRLAERREQVQRFRSVLAQRGLEG